MKSLFVKFGVILIGLAIFGYTEACDAADAWVLWKQETEAQPNGGIETRWFIQTALTEHSACYAMALRLAEADRKILNAGGKLTVVRVRDKEGTVFTIFYRCFPDTFDPRTQKVD
jgi:hypothetical protein